jgi:tetratricopeptide (TPR) repeat protein
MNNEPPPFLDVQTLLDPPGGGVPPLRPLYWVGAMVVLGITMLFLVSSGRANESVEAFFLLAVLILISMMTISSFRAMRQHRAQQLRLESVEEMIQLRNWPEAAATLQEMLSNPFRSPILRIQGLVYLTSVLIRYQRFDDAIAVQSEVLEKVQLDPGTDYSLRVGRAIAMLREDHLFDADRAISELRRLGDRNESPGLALVELYRDVKTGHPDDAIKLFEQRQAMMRDKLGHRVGDAHALVARAYQLLEREDEARRAWERATVLTPAIELVRRYPEVEKTADQFSAAPAPLGM